jgi:putative membrane protein insertion efficiency factor
VQQALQPSLTAGAPSARSPRSASTAGGRLASGAVRLARLVSAAVAALLLLAIAIYRALLSPVLAQIAGGGCRFEPTCSVYAAESIRRAGPWRGGRRALARLLRCHPFHPGGFDPPVSSG